MNFFSVLDDSDNEDVKVVPKKTGAKDAAPAAGAKKDVAPAKNAAPAKKDAAPAKKDAAPAKKDDSKPRASKDEFTSGGKAREPKVSHAASNAVDADKEAGKENNRGGNRNRERHGERHGAARTGEAGERRPKREFDRRSGTGRGREVSRGGRGAFGAGNPAQDAIDAEKDPKAAIEGAVDGVAETPADEEEAVEEAAPAEPEPTTFTLDEYMQKREEARQKAASIAAVNARTVNKDEFAGMTTLAVALDDYVASSVSKADSATRKDQRSTAKNQVLDVAFKYPAPQPERERGPRFEGGRGEGRGGRREGREGGRGEGRGARGAGRGAPRSGAAPAAFNPADFPSL